MITPKLAAFILAITTLTLLSSLAKALSVGNQAPNFSLPLLDDPTKIISLAESEGKLRYLDFWASWCAPCRLSLPAILDLQNELGADQLEVIAVNVDENPKDALRFLKRFAPKHNVITDPKGEVAALYELPGMPTSFIINGAGNVVYRHLGFKEKDIDIIRQHLMTLLEVGTDEN
jgi:thiol-disulfide isomerase/thioredoxin